MRSLSFLCLFVLCLTQGLTKASNKTTFSNDIKNISLAGNATINELRVSTIRPPTIIENSDDMDSNWVEFDVWGGEGGNFGGITIGHTAAVNGHTGDQPYIRIRADGAYSYMVENTSPGAEWAQSIGVYDGLNKLGNMGFCGIGPNYDYQSWGFREIGGGGESWWNGQSVITLWKTGKIQFMQPMEGDGTFVRTSKSEPTAYMVLAQGNETPNSAPLKFVAGNTLETPEAGAVEFDGSSLYVTDANSTRQTVSTLEANQTFTGANTFTNDIEVSGSVNGIILTSPNGSKFRITVNDDGTLSTTIA